MGRKSTEKSALPTTDSRPSSHNASADEKHSTPGSASAANSTAGDEKKQNLNNEKSLEKLDSRVVKVKDANDDPFAHLPAHEAEILRRQVFVPTVKVGIKTLYRYSTRNDLLIIALSCICAIAGGAAQPLMTVSVYLFPFRVMRDLLFERRLLRYARAWSNHI